MRKVLKKAALCTFGFSMLVGCASEEDTIVMAPVPVVQNQFEPTTEWTSSIGDGVGHYFSRLTPAYAYDKIYVASRDGLVKALDPKNGKTIWEQDLEQDDTARLSGGLTLTYGKVFIGSENGEIITLDAETGEELWREKVDGEVIAKPLADEGYVIVHTSRGALVAFDAETGTEKWEINSEVPSLTLRGDSAPVSISGGVFWGMSNGRLAAALMSKGQLLWQQPVGTPKGATEIDRLVDVDSSPLILGGRLYTIGYNGQLIALDLRTGQPAWKRNYSSAMDMSTDGKRLFLVTEKDHVVAVDARSGTELWNNKELEYRQLTSPIIIDNYVVLADNEGYLHWLDKESGLFVSQQEIDSDGIAVSPIVVGDSFLIVTREGDIKKMRIK
ncbi:MULTISPECIES: outer membrane protein assembly factor BamB [Aliivibrio]|jgi:outer membrane protein assembly factor BamB|uniref:Outer membrane protein assembly factor BamB n=3 Tax=Aliivibrio TaxID=511678 RepID=A0A1B9NYM7_ALILO|nr:MULTISPECIES: outer membrane protein assembly factor BamB [Aliivibrio]AZL84132.1 outer membrane protein assembly factor BamB [Aliivibrio salmonicida]MBB1312695.1 outer membrane protein assembly factor BamB [Aliivibrio sp. SR45-2]OCH20911.1 outer membrane protein assembly factor BamB [Aliivibrio logei]OEF09907.1 outer membrane protein assembly factor BamB [Aliivibrio logei 5S-186]CAQ78417.1 lipoprotein precursor [Aliivibrio salmonicida LFI1238]